MFMIGGFSGVMHAAARPTTRAARQLFCRGDHHYVLIGGSLFSLLAGIHYWFRSSADG